MKAVVKIEIPKGCKKTGLSVNALDSYTRELAKDSTVIVEGKLLLCSSFKVNKDQSLSLTLLPPSYELTEKTDRVDLN